MQASHPHDGLEYTLHSQQDAPIHIYYPPYGNIQLEKQKKQQKKTTQQQHMKITLNSD